MITVDHALRAGGLPEPHRKPFDRMPIAQTQAEGLALISNARAFDAYGISASVDGALPQTPGGSRRYDGRHSRPYEFDAVGPAVPAETLFVRRRRRS